MKSYAKLKFVKDTPINGQVQRQTQELTIYEGPLQLGGIFFTVSKIGKNHITLTVDEQKNPRARIVFAKTVFNKTVVVPLKSSTANLGKWIEFIDGCGDTRYLIYISSIYFYKED